MSQTITGPNKTRESKPSTKNAVLGTLGVVAAGGLLIFVMNALKKTPDIKPEAEIVPAKVQTLTAVPQSEEISVYTQGSVTPVHSVSLISEVAGRVTAIAPEYSDGGFFNKDEALVTIDDRDYHFALRQANSDVMKAKELYALEQGRARQAKREWRDLGNSDANDLFLRKPQLASAKSAIDAAQANVEKAQINLERTRISAPFHGRIQRKQVDVGQYVTPGTPIAEVYSTETVQVRLPLTDRQVAKVDLPLTAKAQGREDLPEVLLTTVYGGKQFSWHGKIVRTEASFDLKSRVIYAVAEVEKPYEPQAGHPPLSVGMYVSAEITGKTFDEVVRLPRKSLHKKDQVILVDDENKLVYKNVDVVQSENDDVLITGLNQGDRILITKVPHAVAGLEVNPNTQTAVVEESTPTKLPNKS